MGWHRSAQWTGPSTLPERIHPAAKLLPGLLIVAAAAWVGAEEFRISLAGAQEKTALLYWKDKWYVPHGTTATTHILKPQIGHLPNGIDLTNSVENEHFCLELVAALRLPAAKSRISDFAGKRVLAIERFDRTWTGDGRLLRLPQEDCCQALSVPPARKYESDGGPGIRKIVEFLKGSHTPHADQRTFLKAQMVFWLLGATDGHAKNFSIRLAPADDSVLHRSMTSFRRSASRRSPWLA